MAGSIISSLTGQLRKLLYDGAFGSTVFTEITENGSIVQSILSHAKPLLSLILLGIGWQIGLVTVLVVATWAILFPPIWLQKWFIIGSKTSVQLAAKIVWLVLGFLFILASGQLFYDNYRASEATGMARLLSISTNHFLGHLANSADRLSQLDRLSLSTILGVAMVERSGNEHLRHLGSLLEEHEQAKDLTVWLKKLHVHFHIANDFDRTLLLVQEALDSREFGHLREASREFVIPPPSHHRKDLASLTRFEGILEGWSVYLLEGLRYWVILVFASVLVLVTIGSFICFVYRRHRLVRKLAILVIFILLGFWQLYLMHLLAASLLGAMCGSFKSPNKPISFSPDGHLNSQSIRRMFTECQANGRFVETLAKSISTGKYPMNESVSLDGQSVNVTVRSTQQTWSFSPKSPSSFMGNAKHAVETVLQRRSQDYSIATNGAQGMIDRMLTAQRHIKTEAVEASIIKALGRVKAMNMAIQEDPVPKLSPLAHQLALAYLSRLQSSLERISVNFSKIRTSKPDQLINQVGLRSIPEVSQHFTTAWNTSRLIGDDCKITGGLLESVHDSICHTVSPGYDGVALMLCFLSLCSIFLAYLAFTNSKYRGVSREAVQEHYDSKNDEEMMERELTPADS